MTGALHGTIGLTMQRTVTLFAEQNRPEQHLSAVVLLSACREPDGERARLF